jgi:hypothetical protein
LTELGAWGEPHMSKRAGGAAQANRSNGHVASGFSGQGAQAYGVETQRVSDGAINPSKARALYPAEMSGGVAPSFGWATADPVEAAVAVAEPSSRLGDPAARKVAEHDAAPKPRPPPVPPPPAAVAAAVAAAVSIDSLVAEDEADEAEGAYLAPSAQQVLMEARVAAEQAKLSKHQEGVNSV